MYFNREEYNGLKKEAEKYKKNEQALRKDGHKPWDVYGSQLSIYSDRYSHLLHGKTFTELFAERYKDRSVLDVLELCGNGAALRGLQFTTATAVTLNDFRTESEKDKDVLNSLTVYEGSLLDPQLWNKLKRDSERKKKRYDFVLIDPVGGWFGLVPLKGSAEYYLYHYIKKTWGVLKPDEGTLFTRMMYINDEKIKHMHSLLQKLQSDYGVVHEANIEIQGILQLKLTRTLDGPSKLPSFRQLIN